MVCKRTSKTNKDLVKDPFVLEFLDIKENTNYIESDLEKNKFRNKQVNLYIS